LALDILNEEKGTTVAICRMIRYCTIAKELLEGLGAIYKEYDRDISICGCAWALPTA
jgi:hypothetical protein